MEEIEVFQQLLLEKNIDKARIYLELGRIYLKQENLQLAETYLTLAINKDPNRLELIYDYLLLLDKTKEYHKARPYISLDRCKTEITDPIYAWKYPVQASYTAYKYEDYDLAISLGTYVRDKGFYPKEKQPAVDSNLEWFHKGKNQQVNQSKIESGKYSFGQFTLNNLFPEIIVIDDFFSDPDSVREFGLNQQFNKDGFSRPVSNVSDSHKTVFDRIVGKITYWPTNNGCFHYITSDFYKDQSDYTAIIYLTPNPSSKTKFYKTGFEQIIKNLYNRCVIFKGHNYVQTDNNEELFSNDSILAMIFYFNIY